MEMCCVRGGLFRVNISIPIPDFEDQTPIQGSSVPIFLHRPSHVPTGKAGRAADEALTLVVPLYTLLQPIRWPSETIPIHLGVDELERWDETEFLFRVLRCIPSSLEVSCCLYQFCEGSGGGGGRG